MKIKLVSVLEITMTSKSFKGRVLLCLVIQGGLGTTAEVTQHNWLKMVAGAYATNPRRQKTYKNGYSAKANGFAAHEQAKLKEFKESFTEDFEDTPFQVAVLTYLSYFFLILFGYLRDFMRKYGLEKSKAPKEGGNEVRMWSKSAFTYKEIFIASWNHYGFQDQAQFSDVSCCCTITNRYTTIWGRRPKLFLVKNFLSLSFDSVTILPIKKIRRGRNYFFLECEFNARVIHKIFVLVLRSMQRASFRNVLTVRRMGKWTDVVIEQECRGLWSFINLK